MNIVISHRNKYFFCPAKYLPDMCGFMRNFGENGGTSANIVDNYLIFTFTDDSGVPTNICLNEITSIIIEDCNNKNNDVVKKLLAENKALKEQIRNSTSHPDKSEG